MLPVELSDCLNRAVVDVRDKLRKAVELWVRRFVLATKPLLRKGRQMLMTTARKLVPHLRDYRKSGWTAYHLNECSVGRTETRLTESG